tara:strand:+ start:142 stop:426 length:285 start_codon:yes stop_codon:yes gene_type:complete
MKKITKEHLEKEYEYHDVFIESIFDRISVLKKELDIYKGSIGDLSKGIEGFDLFEDSEDNTSVLDHFFIMDFYGSITSLIEEYQETQKQLENRS